MKKVDVSLFDSASRFGLASLLLNRTSSYYHTDVCTSNFLTDLLTYVSTYILTYNVLT